MKKTKKSSWKSNLIFYGILGIIMFTPIGFPIRVFVISLFSFTPSVEDIEDQKMLSSYQWTLVNSEGKQVEFQASKNKVILVNFWATWCPPCMAELPELNELYNKFKDNKYVDFYFVSNQDKRKVSTTLSEKGFIIPNYNGLTTPPMELQSNALPTTFLISKKGNIVIEKTGAANWNSEDIVLLINDLIEE